MTHLWVRAEQRLNEERAGITAEGVNALIAAGIRVTVEESSTRAAGLKAQFGTMGKPYNAGLAATAGVEVAPAVGQHARTGAGEQQRPPAATPPPSPRTLEAAHGGAAAGLPDALRHQPLQQDHHHTNEILQRLLLINRL